MDHISSLHKLFMDAGYFRDSGKPRLLPKEVWETLSRYILQCTLEYGGVSVEEQAIFLQLCDVLVQYHRHTRRQVMREAADKFAEECVRRLKHNLKQAKGAGEHEHDDWIYSQVELPTNPPKYQRICRQCGFMETTRPTTLLGSQYSQAEYDRLVRRFHPKGKAGGEDS